MKYSELFKGRSHSCSEIFSWMYLNSTLIFWHSFPTGCCGIDGQDTFLANRRSCLQILALLIWEWLRSLCPPKERKSWQLLLKVCLFLQRRGEVDLLATDWAISQFWRHNNLKLVGSVAQWIAHWTSRLLNVVIQRLWVRVPSESQRFFIFRSTLDQKAARVSDHQNCFLKQNFHALNIMGKGKHCSQIIRWLHSKTTLTCCHSFPKGSCGYSDQDICLVHRKCWYHILQCLSGNDCALCPFHWTDSPDSAFWNGNQFYRVSGKVISMPQSV